MHFRKTFKNNVPILGVFWDPSGPVHTISMVFLVHTLERKLSKMPNITEYPFKLAEIWLIGKDIKGLKPNFYDILADRLGSQKTPVGCYVRYMIWPG